MASFNLDEYQKQQSQRKAANTGNGGERKPVHFMKEFLDKDGDQVVVRFPYTSPQDLLFESVHKVVGVFPGDKFGKSVRCTGDDKCPLCNSENEAIRKRKTMFYAKMIVYKPTATGADLCATVWERPAAFADSELKNLMQEYGDLSDYLFKITRSGKGTDTRYTIIPVNMNSPVYSQEVYKTKDLSCLENIDATKILSKSIEQYNQAINPNAEATETAESQVKETETVDPKVYEQAGYNNPQYGSTPQNNSFVTQPEEDKVEVKEVQTPQTTTTTNTAGNTVTRFRF